MARASAGVASHDLANCKGAIAASSQGAAPAARAITSRGNDVGRRSDYRRARTATAYAKAAAAAQRRQEGLGQSFCEKDDPTRLNSGNFEDCPHIQNSQQF
ncbi:hypothetical protein BHE74_00007976 [Ensete ventricosum]|nr:hypothetical protein BHE74_00007976 [Ensete ventricosum]